VGAAVRGLGAPPEGRLDALVPEGDLPVHVEGRNFLVQEHEMDVAPRGTGASLQEGFELWQQRWIYY